jgi:ribonucleoside-diphosphate reductase alpha chain
MASSKYKPRVYLEVDGATVGDVLDWLCNAEFPWNVQDIKFPTGALDTLQETLVAQSHEIEELLERTDQLSAELEQETDRAQKAEHEVEELLSPSSRRPPPHFKLPDERPSIVHKFKIGMNNLGHGYIIAGTYPGTNEVGEIFIKMATPTPDPKIDHAMSPDELMTALAEMKRHVSDLTAFLRGILDQLAIAVSIGLQRGIPLEVYIEKFIHTRFPPDGLTRHETIRSCSSIIDYLFRWLSWRFLEQHALE